MSRCHNCGAFLPERDPDEAHKAKAAELRSELEAAGHEVLPGGRVYERSAALVMGVNRSTVRNWRCYHRGPPFLKSGDRVLYDLADMARFMAARHSA